MDTAIVKLRFLQMTHPYESNFTSQAPSETELGHQKEVDDKLRKKDSWEEVCMTPEDPLLQLIESLPSLDLEELIAFLTKYEAHHTLALIYSSKGSLTSALNIWQRLFLLYFHAFYLNCLHELVQRLAIMASLIRHYSS
ncbi:unnamed protein product [Protopolystoma xenopodis]|uniref:Uncharacterized protein n=1 Tax=Protopolystoma xenopodis TaxID=117903 RepID=A0A448X5C4_9PLAT|nr:unnamed protein product [Protopolystoma xenopodis]